MFENRIKPPLVLTLICVVLCGLLVFAYESTYVDSNGVITEKMLIGLEEIYGNSDGFEILKNSDGTVFTPENVTSVLKNSDGIRAYEITSDGYNKGGLHVLIGFDDTHKIKGIAILDIGETPGLGTKVTNSEFLTQFDGLDFSKLAAEAPVNTDYTKAKVKTKAVWGTNKEIDKLKSEIQPETSDSFKLDAVTGATYSSNGMYSAVKAALKAENEMAVD